MVTYRPVATAWRKRILKQDSKTSFLRYQGKGPRVGRGRESFDVREDQTDASGPETSHLSGESPAEVPWGSSLCRSPEERLQPPAQLPGPAQRSLQLPPPTEASAAGPSLARPNLRTVCPALLLQGIASPYEVNAGSGGVPQRRASDAFVSM